MKPRYLVLVIFFVAGVMPISSVEADSRNPILEDKLNTLESAVVNAENFMKTMKSRIPLCPQDKELIDRIKSRPYEGYKSVMLELETMMGLNKKLTLSQSNRYLDLRRRVDSLSTGSGDWERADKRTTEYKKCGNDMWDRSVEIQVLRVSCESKEGEGCFELGVRYENGQGVKQDTSQAATLYRKACDGGVANGCLALGVMYANGLVGKEDMGQAASFFRKACDKRMMEGCFNLGLMYANGQGVKRDVGQARRYFREVCGSYKSEKYDCGEVLKQIEKEVDALEVPNASPGFDSYVDNIIKVIINNWHTSFDRYLSYETRVDKKGTTVINFRVNNGERPSVTDMKVIQSSAIDREVKNSIESISHYSQLRFPKHEWVGGYIVFNIKFTVDEDESAKTVKTVEILQPACGGLASECFRLWELNEKNERWVGKPLESKHRTSQELIGDLFKDSNSLPDAPRFGDVGPSDKQKKAFESKPGPLSTEELNRALDEELRKIKKLEPLKKQKVDQIQP